MRGVDTQGVGASTHAVMMKVNLLLNRDEDVSKVKLYVRRYVAVGCPIAMFLICGVDSGAFWKCNVYYNEATYDGEETMESVKGEGWVNMTMIA